MNNKNYFDKNILLVEDDRVTTELQMLNLKKVGYVNVIHVSSGEKAIQLIDSNTQQIDLILMDIHLGSGIDGIKTAKTILENHDLPLIFLSSHTDADVIEEAGNISSYGYVVKNNEIIVLDVSIKMAFRVFESHIKELNNEKMLKEKTDNLIKQNGLFSALLKVLPIGVFMVEAPTGKPLLANEPAQKLLGRGILPDVSSDTLSEVYSAYKAGTNKLYPKNEMPILLGMKGLSSHIDDMEVLKPDESKVLLEVYGTPIFDDNGHIWASLVSFFDITERKKAEKDLSSMKNYLTEIINSMPSSLIVVNEDLLVIQLNKIAQLKTGSIEKSSEGRQLIELFPLLTSNVSMLKKAVREKTVLVDLKVVERINGKTLNYNLTMYPLSSDGINRAVIRLDDVTERVALEEIMIQSDKILSVGGLAAGFAHEINNPLSGMIQSVDVLSRRLSLEIDKNTQVADEIGVSFEAIKSYMEKRDISTILRRLKESGLRISKIVKNMLSFARKSDFSFERVDMTQVLDLAIDLAATDYDIKKEFDFKNIIINRHYEINLPLIECEVTKIQQVFLNLFRNGAESMQDKKKLCDSDGTSGYKPTFNISISLDSKTGLLTITISDNGMGIHALNRNKIFEPFFTTKKPGLGTGLGLSVSYFIITKNHGGQMSVESEEGLGTTFIIKLPVDKKPYDFNIE
ncbi:MAG: hypothetical protein A2015_05950 [Spirochaetes bacterium GWF1_31_7]|nr:MAG: hypothetical protein A2Y30_07760 [Spirochaetes bacterium GWE1_32_154]OHD50800.1 MAG: hypothetical protein A2Y29_02580 [Spirochaetes bacterium GWE2_31_10]OHD52737.1 MAG: hypothetical protein A2015_05950 [Spirochaetes bacterium GWF1_31_7]OHD78547.1 MAG: hypothetical protein A2355_15905 [Spirochaetes bacterium RIFOXYB1_FULL_32_8]HBD95412.1 hypothetical protein [Spirochaetia bacterium]